MVDSHHGMNDLIPLAYNAVWERLRAGGKLSAVKDGAHAFSFQLRPNGTVKAVGESADLAVGCLKDGVQRLNPPSLKWRQAPLDAPERRHVCRLFDGDLLQGRAPTAFILVSRDPFDIANERAYAAMQPDLYRYIIDRGFVSYLPSIRNVGRLSDAQETNLRKWIAKEARKGFHVVPSTPAHKPADDEEKREREENIRILREIERKEDEEEARRRSKKDEIDDDIPL
jgi:hypothetical protein